MPIDVGLGTNLHLPPWICRRCLTLNAGWKHCYEPKSVRGPRAVELEWWCANGCGATELDTAGHCARCGSDAIDWNRVKGDSNDSKRDS